MIEINYRSTSVTDRLTELCIRGCRGFAILVSRWLLVVVIHAVSRSYTMTAIVYTISHASASTSNTEILFQGLLSRVLRTLQRFFNQVLSNLVL
jgi:hypothetical protein